MKFELKWELLPNYSFNVFEKIRINNLIFALPSDINKFLYDYKYSKFVECKNYRRKKVIPKLRFRVDIIKNGLLYIKSVLEEYKKPYWLAAGTLLGNFVRKKCLIFLMYFLVYRMVQRMWYYSTYRCMLVKIL